MLHFEEFDCNNILLLDTIDSTNNYAHQLINKGNHQHGQIVQALHQTAGKGQRGNTWHSLPNDNLLMSIIIDHQGSSIGSQFILNMAISLALAATINKYTLHPACFIKWSNDIYVGDNKIAGILVENIIKGSQWSQSIIGIGVNINATFYHSDLVNPTSLYQQIGKYIDINFIRNLFIESFHQIITIAKKDEEGIIKDYNALLYKRGEKQMFAIGDTLIAKEIVGVNINGEIMLKEGNKIAAFAFGEAKQLIGSLN